MLKHLKWERIRRPTKQQSNRKLMDGNISKLTREEIEEIIRQLEHTYVEFFGGNKSTADLHSIHQRIIELRQELHKKTNS